MSEFRNEDLRIEGDFFDGVTTEKKTGFIQYDSFARTVKIWIEEILVIEKKVADLDISSRIGNIQRVISFSDGSNFVTSENDLVDHLQKRVGASSKLGYLNKLERNSGLVILSMLVVAVFLWSAVTIGIPFLSKQLAFNLPFFEKIGDDLGHFETMDSIHFTESQLSLSRQRELRNLFEGYSTLPDVKVYFRKAKKPGFSNNVFAFPGKSIVFTDSFIELADSDQQLLAVFFHEEGHIANRHFTRQVIQASALNAVLFLLFGDLVGYEILASIPTLIMYLSYSRDFELEADKYSVDSLLNNDLSPTHMLSILEKIKARSETEESTVGVGDGLSHYWSTHPPTEDRFKMIQDREAELRNAY